MIFAEQSGAANLSWLEREAWPGQIAGTISGGG
jgi:hypothetical protein